MAAPADAGLVLGLAMAPAVGGFLALIASAVPMLAGGSAIPRGILLVIAVELAAAIVLRVNDSNPLMHSWISAAICTAILLPLLSLQVAFLHEPYLSWAAHSASPAMVATAVVGVIVAAGAAWAVTVAWEHPDEAGLLYLPQALMVPALIGTHETVSQTLALRTLGMVLLLAGAATAVSWLLRPAGRMFAPAAALGVEVVGLWLGGRGPWLQATSGDIVWLLYLLMLGLAVLLVVATPLAAASISHGAALASRRDPVIRRSTPRPPVSRGPVVPRS